MKQQRPLIGSDESPLAHGGFMNAKWIWNAANVTAAALQVRRQNALCLIINPGAVFDRERLINKHRDINKAFALAVDSYGLDCA